MSAFQFKLLHPIALGAMRPELPFVQSTTLCGSDQGDNGAQLDQLPQLLLQRPLDAAAHSPHLGISIALSSLPFPYLLADEGIAL
jgi:hypothetical protein